jgi:hypothetical protein
MFFSPSYEILQPKYVNVFTCSNIISPITILLLFGMCPSNAITLDFSEYFHSKLFLYFLRIESAYFF